MKQNQYELTYLIDPSTSEDARNSLNSAVDEQVTALSGTVSHDSPALRKKLAYKVARQDSAFMRVMNIEMPAEKVLGFMNFLKKSNGILRTTLLATSMRDRITPEVLEKHGKKKGKGGFAKHDKKKDMHPSTGSGQEKKEVTMQAVEKGIEEALTEEVK